MGGKGAAAEGDGHSGQAGTGVGVDLRAGFEAVFRDPVGQVVQQRWAVAAVAVGFEDLEPVSAFPVVPGRRWGPGLWWSATTGRHVASGSNAMRAQLMVLDRDPRVVGLAGRPVRLLWRDGGGQTRSWVPQLFARYADGTALLADCPSHREAGGRRAADAAVAVAAACHQVGWTYRRLEPLEEVLAANLRWLAGYRHPRNQGRPGLLPAVLKAFASPRPLLEGVEEVGDPIEVLPAAFHALWHGRLTTPLDTPLHERVLVGPGNLPGGHAAGERSNSTGAGAMAEDDQAPAHRTADQTSDQTGDGQGCDETGDGQGCADQGADPRRSPRRDRGSVGNEEAADIRAHAQDSGAQDSGAQDSGAQDGGARDGGARTEHRGSGCLAGPGGSEDGQ